MLRSPWRTFERISKEGGACAAEAPQQGFAWPLKVNTSVPPWRMNAAGNQGLVHVRPFTRKLSMKKAEALCERATMRIVPSRPVDFRFSEQRRRQH